MTKSLATLPLRLGHGITSSPTRSWICRRCLSVQTSPLLSGIRSPAFSKQATEAQRTRQSWVDEWITKALPHRVPPQYLQHCTSPLLSVEEQQCRTDSPVRNAIVGVVISAGTMDKTVKVRTPGQRWERRIQKHFSHSTDHLVHDPNNSLVEGDVVSLHRLRVSSTVHHVVASIISPFGKPIEERNPIPSPEERLAEYKYMRHKKLNRRGLRSTAVRGKPDATVEVQPTGFALEDRGKNA